MPYKPSDAKRFTKKANKPVEQRQWKHVFESSIKSGDTETVAIKKANSVIKRGK